MEVVKISHRWVSHFQDSEEENNEAQDGDRAVAADFRWIDQRWFNKKDMLICWLQLILVQR